MENKIYCHFCKQPQLAGTSCMVADYGEVTEDGIDHKSQDIVICYECWEGFMLDHEDSEEEANKL